MKKIHQGFSGEYEGQQSKYNVWGNLTTMPAGTYEEMPDEDLIIASYWIFEDSTDLSHPPRHNNTLIREVNNEFQTGDIFNKRFRPQQSPFLSWLKDVVLQAYRAEDKPDFNCDASENL
jgi:hypothetical protein